VKRRIAILAALLAGTAVAGLRAGKIEHPVLHENPPALIRRVEPRCNPECIGGPVVVLSAVVTREGRVTKIRVLKPGTKEFTAACIRAFARWRYRPARAADHEPVPAFVTVSFAPPPPVPA